MKKLFTLLKNSKKITKTKHYVGLPPELTEGEDNRRILPLPDVLIIEETQEGIFLYRYTSKGDFCGDTWHNTIDEAKEQAKFEYGDSINEWKQIPNDVKDIIAYVINHIKSGVR